MIVNGQTTYDMSTKTVAYYTFNPGSMASSVGSSGSFTYQAATSNPFSYCTLTSEGPGGNWASYCTRINFLLISNSYTSPYLSICYWAKMNINNYLEKTFASIIKSGVLHYFIVMDSELKFAIMTQSPDYSISNTPSNLNWMHICSVISGSYYTIYVNNIIVRTITVMGNTNSDVSVSFFNNAFIDEVRIFNKLLTAADVNAIYNYRGDGLSISLLSTCITRYSCLDLNMWGNPCTICPSNTYISTAYFDTCASNGYTNTKKISMCPACKLPQNCVKGTYLNYQCSGLEKVKNACLACDTKPCSDPTKYKTICAGLQNSICNLTYTQCQTGYYLSGYDMYNDGVCVECSVCLEYSKLCLAKSDAICKESCSPTSNCVHPRGVCIYTTNQTVGKCYACPIGYKKLNNVCVECPFGTICDEYAVTQTVGICPHKTMPIYENNVLTCSFDQCNDYNYTLVNSVSMTRSYIRNSCNPKKVCINGYYTLLTVAGDTICTACTNVFLTSMISITSGLSLHDSVSCLFEPSPKNTGNSKGYYSNYNALCPWGYTSEANNALTVSDCKQCPRITSQYAKIVDAWLCTWNCMDGYMQVGDTCTYAYDVLDCDTIVDNMCVIRPFPWQPVGYEWNDQYNSTETYNFVYSSIMRYEPLQFKSDLITINFTWKTSYSNTAYHAINIYKKYIPTTTSAKYVTTSTSIITNPITTTPMYSTTTQAVTSSSTTSTFYTTIITTTPAPRPTEDLSNNSIAGRVCSVSYDASNDVIYLVFCGIPIIFYLDKKNKAQRLIGNSTSGYSEGMKNDALFEIELYIAMSSTMDIIVVLDSYNCVLREIVIGDDGPGDFRTKSYWVYGTVVNQKPFCVDLILPKYLYPLSNPIMILFINNQNEICQYYTKRKMVVCLTNVLITTNFTGVTSDTSGTILSFQYLDKQVSIVNNAVICPDDYTSISGGSCTIYKPWNNGASNGFYIVNGIAHQCTPATCGKGYYSAACTRTSPAVCQACMLPIDANLYVAYFIAGSCEYELVSPCPKNMYYGGPPHYMRCISCPGIMTTVAANRYSPDDCICPSPLERVGDDCFLLQYPTLFQNYQPNRCEFWQYYSPIKQKCTYCIEINCYDQPAIGEYYTGCSTPPGKCIIPGNATAITIGYTSDPKSCFWDCNWGFQKTDICCPADVVCRPVPV